MFQISENGQYQEIHQAPIYKTQKLQAWTMSHTPPWASRMFEKRCLNEQAPPSVLTLSHAPTVPFRAFTRQALTRASVPWRHRWHNLLRPGLTRLSRQTRFGPFIRPGPNHLKLNLKKKKEKEKKKTKEKVFWPSLTLTKKSKFSKMAYSTQFFEYIPILRSVSSFEARKFYKLSNS